MLRANMDQTLQITERTQNPRDLRLTLLGSAMGLAGMYFIVLWLVFAREAYVFFPIGLIGLALATDLLRGKSRSLFVLRYAGLALIGVGGLCLIAQFTEGMFFALPGISLYCLARQRLTPSFAIIGLLVLAYLLVTFVMVIV
jgi:hypothetical protein